jgi:LPXTG-motif cell wall-anchored protein
MAVSTPPDAIGLSAVILRKPLAILMLVAALLLALPATAAFAQSAGDDQYQDPLGGGTGTTPSGPSNGSGGGSGGNAGSAGTGATAPAAPKPAGSSGPVTLPRTGFDALIPAVAGLLLLAGGAVLLVRTRRQV